MIYLVYESLGELLSKNYYKLKTSLGNNKLSYYYTTIFYWFLLDNIHILLMLYKIIFLCNLDIMFIKHYVLLYFLNVSEYTTQ